MQIIILNGVNDFQQHKNFNFTLRFNSICTQTISIIFVSISSIVFRGVSFYGVFLSFFLLLLFLLSFLFRIFFPLIVFLYSWTYPSGRRQQLSSIWPISIIQNISLSPSPRIVNTLASSVIRVYAICIACLGEVRAFMIMA